MNQKLIFLLLLSGIFLSATASAEKRHDGSAWTISANVINKVTHENVTDTIQVELLAPDSTTVDTRRICAPIGGKARFQFSVGTEHASYMLRLSNPDYETTLYPVTLEKRRRHIDFGDLTIRRLTMAERNHKLGEVTVRATKVKFFHKGDTIVFNADAFNLAQGSMLDALIEQLPGTQLKADGTITVNGRFVSQLLLDGKDFFKGNNSVMLENFPAYMVKNVKVYDKVERDQQRLGVRTSDNLVMDVSLKKEFRKGVIANAEGGLGSSRRYDLRAFGLLYSANNRLSVFGKLNNTNEIRVPGREGNWNDSRGEQGRSTVRTAGLDYGVTRSRMDLSGNVMGFIYDTNEKQFMARQQFLPEGDLFTRSWQTDFTRRYNLSTRHEAVLWLGQQKQHYLTAGLTAHLAKNNINTTGIEATFSQVPDDDNLRESIITGAPIVTSALNRLLQSACQRKESLGTQIWVNAQGKINGRDDVYGAQGTVNFNNSRSKKNEQQQLFLADNPEQLRKRLNNTPSHSIVENVELYYGWRPSAHLTIKPKYRVYNSSITGTNDWYALHQKESVETMLLSMAAEEVRTLDPANSYHSVNHTFDHAPGLQLNYDFLRRHGNEDDGFISLQAAFDILLRHETLDYKGVRDFRLSHDFVLLNPWAILAFTTYKRAHYLDVKFHMNTYSPSLMNLTDITFTSDPLNHQCGNPDLKNYTQYRFETNYRADGLSRSHGIWLSAQAGYHFTVDAIAMQTTYDRTTGVRLSSPVNINGNRRAWARSDFQFPFGSDRRWILNGLVYYAWQANADMVMESGMQKAERQLVHTQSHWDRLGVEYNHNGHSVKLSGELSFNHSTSPRAGFTTIDVANFNYGLNARFRLPADIQLSTDLLMYSRRGFADNSLNTNSLVWNARITKSLLKGKMMIKIDAFDLLHQIRKTSVSINSLARTERTYNSLPSYVMLRLAWNFNRQPRR